MTFTVTYRAKDGALREERIEAASRAECVTECRRRGISPTGIKEGKPGDSGRSGKSGKSGISGRSGKLWFAIGVALVIAIAGGLWWWFGGRGATEPAEAPAKPKVEKPKAAKPKTASIQQQGSEKPAVVETNASETAKAPAPAPCCCTLVVTPAPCCCTLVVSPSAAVTLMGFMPISMRRRGFGRKAEAPCILDDTKLIQNEYKN